MEAAGVASELGNARLHRVLPADAAQWLHETLLVGRLFELVRSNRTCLFKSCARLLRLVDLRQVLVGNAAAPNALECLERLAELSDNNNSQTSPLLTQIGTVGLAHMQRELQQHASSDVDAARAVQLLIRVSRMAATVSADTPALMDCVRLYSEHVARIDATHSLGSVRLECGRLWACAVENLTLPAPTGAGDTATLQRLSDWFFAFPRANLFHVACVRLVRAALERDVLLDALLARDGFAVRCAEYFRQHGASWPRSPCVGEVVRVLHAVRQSGTAAAAAFVATQPEPLWSDVSALLEQERKPLADAVVSSVKRNADFVGKADIDGIGEKK